MFENKELNKLIDTRMSPQDKQDFWCDIRECDINLMLSEDCFYGLQRYFLKIDLPSQESGFKQLV